MALTLQSRRELAGDLPKVHPQLRKLHLVEKPKKRHLLRNTVFVGRMIAALLKRLRRVEKPRKRHLRQKMAFVGGTIAAAGFVAVVVWWRRGCHGAVAGDRRDAQASSPKPKTLDAEPDWDGPVTDADAPQDIAMPVPA